MEIYRQVILLAIMIFLSAFFALCESALLSLSKFKVRYLADKKKFGAAHVKKLKDNPEALLSTVLVGNNLVNAAAAVLTTSISLQLFHNNVLGIATGIAAFLILIFGDMIPKSIGANNNEVLAPLIAPIIWYLGIIAYPLIKILDLLLKGINRILGIKKMPLITEEELKHIVKVSEEEGTIQEIEKKLIQRIFDFDTITVADVMTRKDNMISVSSEGTIKDVLHIPTAKMYSRFPVFGKHKEDITGILHLKDILKFVREGKTDAKIKGIMRKPLFVFESKKMDSTLKLFQKSKQHMAVVLNEKGNIVGVVTIENILEEVVGEIIDETDRINPDIQEVSKNAWVARGSTEADVLNKKTGILIKKDFVDLDSFILSKLGRAPKLNEQLVHNSYKITMEDVQGKKVIRARIEKA